MKKIIDTNGVIFYCDEDNELHREDGPAVELVSSYKAWYKNGKCHREDGPAREYSSGYKEYWYNGISYSDIKTDEEWVRFIKLMVFQ